jgi:hypothetical protein
MHGTVVNAWHCSECMALHVVNAWHCSECMALHVVNAWHCSECMALSLFCVFQQLRKLVDTKVTGLYTSGLGGSKRHWKGWISRQRLKRVMTPTLIMMMMMMHFVSHDCYIPDKWKDQ